LDTTESERVNLPFQEFFSRARLILQNFSSFSFGMITTEEIMRTILFAIILLSAALWPYVGASQTVATSTKILCRQCGFEVPVDPRRLFLILIADVLGPMEMSLGGGSVIGEMREEKRPFWGRLSLGLGGVAEIEAGTVGIISGLANGSAAIPSASFKLKLVPERNRFPFVGIAGALRSSTWHSEERGSVKFDKRVSTLYFVASKTFGPISMHAGLSINDLRIRTKYAGTGELLSQPLKKPKTRTGTM